MNVLSITHYTELYGANRSLLSLLNGIPKHNFNGFLIAPYEGAITKEVKKRGIASYTLPFKRWMSTDRWKAPARLALNLSVLPVLARKASEWDVDLVHTNSSVTPIGALLSEVLSLPHVWHVREFGLRDFGLHYDWGRKLFKTFMGRAKATIAVSESVRQSVLNDVDTPSHVVYNGVISKTRLDQLGKREKYSVSKNENPFTFAIVGQICPEKGQKQALRALHLFKQEGGEGRLLVAGDGSSEHVMSLRQLCQSLGLGDVVSFLGYVNEPFKVYQKADAVLMCSPHEAMGRVTAEAMAAARPVVGYNSDGTAELIDNEQNGLLYDGTTEDLADCMRRLMEAPDWARSLGENGQQKASAQFTNEIYAQRV